MEKYFGPYAQLVYAMLRIVVGFLFFCHGVQKVFGLFGGVGGAAAPLTSLIGVAGILELMFGGLVALGFHTGYAAFLASGQMAVAYFIGHFPSGWWPIMNDGEEAVLYCFVFLYMATQGSGKWSLDAARGESAFGSATAGS